MRVTMIPIVVSALGTVSNDLERKENPPPPKKKQTAAESEIRRRIETIQTKEFFLDRLEYSEES